jgi:hypothetical protein
MSDALYRSSRPLRAAIGVVGGWIAMRTAMLWPHATTVEAVVSARADVVPSTAEAPLIDMFEDQRTALAVNDKARVSAGRTPLKSKPHGTALGIVAPVVIPTPVRALTTTLPASAPQPVPSATMIPARFEAPTLSSATSPRDRLSLSAWVLARGGGPTGLASSSALGGAQAGVRMFYEPGPRGVALTGRLSAPLSARSGREAALGFAIRRGAVGVIVEQRFALDGPRRSTPSVTAYGGIYAKPLAANFKLDGYAQAGIVGVAHPQAFADGALRLERPVSSKIALGAGVWGGAQPGAARLDIGPQIVAHVKVAGGSMRIAADWRVRVAGSASPGAGPSVSAGFDF